MRQPITATFLAVVASLAIATSACRGLTNIGVYFADCVGN